MTPKEKATELVNKYYIELQVHIGGYSLEASRQCALICVDEIIIETLSEYTNDENHDRVEYWNEVKQEIQNF